MRATRITPTFDRGPTLENIGVPVVNTDEKIIYEFVQSEKLHTVDLARSLKTELFNAATVVRLTAALRRVRMLLIVSHNLVFFITPISLLASAPVGRVLVLVILPLGFPSTFSVLLSLRYDLLYVLLGTYDFWFYWIVALITCVSLGIYVGDMRAVSACFIALGMLVCILVDANVSLSRVFVFSSTLAGMLGCVTFVAVQLQLIPEVSKLSVSYNSRTLSLPDVIANGLVTLVIVLARNAYRRREAVIHNAANKSSICCITFRCTVMLRRAVTTTQPVEGPKRRMGARTSSVPHLISGDVSRLSFTASEMKMIPMLERIDGRRILLGYQRLLHMWSRTARWSLAFFAMSSASLTGILFFYEAIFEQPSYLGLSIASFVGSCLVSQVVWALLQPKMLRRLWRSFDFLFVSLQLSILHACVCDTFRWDRRALLSIAGYVWIHLVLVLDALMPITRQRIGFHKVFAMVVALGFAVGHGGYFVKLIIDRDWALHERVLFDGRVYGHRVRLGVIPLIASRQPILIVWSLRLLWRIYKSREGELILIRGAVAYDSHRDKPQAPPTQ